jgi:hypothetical protein
VPYNLFKLFLVHKKSAYKYIYENWKNKWEKEFSASLAGGNFGPAERRRARGAGGPLGPLAGPRATGRGADGVERWRGGGANRPGLDRRGPVPRRGSGGEARAGVGDHGAGANLAGGCLGWPVHGVVAGAHGGEVASEANGAIGEGKG